MPLKDKEKYRAYMREWYSRPQNRKRVIEKVSARKKESYRGICISCGANTWGNTKLDAPFFCGKPACKALRQKPAVELLMLEIADLTNDLLDANEYVQELERRISGEEK